MFPVGKRGTWNIYFVTIATTNVTHTLSVSYANLTNSMNYMEPESYSSPRHNVNLDITNRHQVSCSFFFISLFHVGKHFSIFIYWMITLSTKILHLYNTTLYQGMENCHFH
jgi:hypothetical protein